MASAPAANPSSSAVLPIAPDAPPLSEPVAGSSRRFKYDGRYTAPLLITSILLGAHLKYGVLESFPQTLLAIAAAMTTEIVLSLLLRGKFPHLASAYVSGISAGILVRSNEWWPLALCAAIAISSKYVLRWRGRHLWNPTNFAISSLVFLAPWAVATLSQQWDNRFWAMCLIWTLGSVILWKLKRFHICAAYALSFFLFAWPRTFFTHQSFYTEIGPITGPMYQLFIFFMITDPKTTVLGKNGQIAVAIGVAAMESLLRLSGNFIQTPGWENIAIHAPYYALFTVGPIGNLIDIWWRSRNAEQTPSPVLAAS